MAKVSETELFLGDVNNQQGATTSVWTGVVAPAGEIGRRYGEKCHVGHIVPDVTCQ